MLIGMLIPDSALHNGIVCFGMQQLIFRAVCILPNAENSMLVANRQTSLPDPMSFVLLSSTNYTGLFYRQSQA